MNLKDSSDGRRGRNRRMTGKLPYTIFPRLSAIFQVLRSLPRYTNRTWRYMGGPAKARPVLSVVKAAEIGNAFVADLATWAAIKCEADEGVETILIDHAGGIANLAAGAIAFDRATIVGAA